MGGGSFIVLVVFLAVSAACAPAQHPVAVAPQTEIGTACLTFLGVLPPEITELRLVSCRVGPTAQVQARARFLVPADVVVPWTEAAQVQWGLGDIVFTCCGYESQAVGTLPANGLPPARQVGAFPGVTFSFVSERLNDGGVFPLGAFDGMVIVDWVEV